MGYCSGVRALKWISRAYMIDGEVLPVNACHHFDFAQRKKRSRFLALARGTSTSICGAALAAWSFSDFCCGSGGLLGKSS